MYGGLWDLARLIELTVRDTIRLYRALRTNEANVRQTFGADGQTFDKEKDASSFADGRINDEGPFWSSPKILRSELDSTVTPCLKFLFS